MKNLLLKFHSSFYLALTILALVVASMLPIHAVLAEERASDNSPLIIQNITVIPMDRDGTIAGQDVWIVNGRVKQIVDHDTIAAPQGAMVIDGYDRFLMPALWDMHAHPFGPATPDGEISVSTAVDQLLPRYTGWGIAGIRDPAQTLAKFVEIRKALSDRPDLPDFYGSGPIFEGKKNRWSKVMATHSENTEQARANAEQLADSGVDFLKLYDTLPAEGFDAVAQVAAERNLPLAGHIPFSVATEYAVDNGQKLIEHLYVDVIQPCADITSDVRLKILDAWIRTGWAGKVGTTRDIMTSRDPARCRTWFGKMAQKGVFITPMLQIELPRNLVIDAAWLDSAVRPSRKFCQGDIGTGLSIPPDVRQSFRDEMFAIIRALDAAGVKLLAGSDNGGDCRNDGYSLHRELQLLSEAGLDNQTVLRSATLYGAEAMRRTDEGRVALGARANLLLLSANPLVNIRNTTAISGLIKDGKYLDTSQLSDLRHLDLSEVETAFRDARNESDIAGF